MNLTEASHNLMIKLADETMIWCQPDAWLPEDLTKAEAGNLTDLKAKGLIKGRGREAFSLTDAGADYLDRFEVKYDRGEDFWG